MDNSFIIPNKNDISEKDFLLISYSLGRTGAPIALQNLAYILQKNGYNPVILSNEDGELRQEYEACGIRVIIEDNLQNRCLDFCKWCEAYPYVLVNTIMYAHCMLKYNINKTLLWWIHEAEEYYGWAGLEEEKCYTLSKYIKPLVVSGIAKRNFEKHFKGKTRKLLYNIVNEKKFVFTIVGMISDRKGHDILYRAFKLMKEEIKANCVVWIVGAGNILNLSSLSQEEAEDFWFDAQLVLFGEIPRGEMDVLYNRSNIILCPSREDPMPMTITEALSKEIPLIVSNECGQSELIKEYDAGIVIDELNPNSLCRAMENAYLMYEELDKKRVNERRLFEDCFSEKGVEKQVNDIINEYYCGE